MKKIADFRIWCGSLVTGLLLLLAAPAWASLGGDVGTVQADQAQMKASVRISRSANYEVHEMRAETGTTVREYVSPSGKVFGVAWQGPSLPDMRQVLGTYFDQYSKAAQGRRARHGPLHIEEPGLVVHSSGHMRSFSGHAYVPQMVPQGVTAEAIQ